MNRWLKAVALVIGTTLVGSCASVQHIAMGKVADALANQGDVFSSDDDPELVGDAIPFSLKLMESLLAQNPHHTGLLLAATSGFTQYSYGWIEQNADEIEKDDPARAAHQKQRAQRLYLRARDYGLRGLEEGHPGFGTGLHTDARAAVRGYW